MLPSSLPAVKNKKAMEREKDPLIAREAANMTTPLLRGGAGGGETEPATNSSVVGIGGGVI